jgi:hypothetical protein
MARYITAEDKSVMDLRAGVMCLRVILNEDVKYYHVDIEKNAKKLSSAILIKMDFQKLKRMLPFWRVYWDTLRMSNIFFLV